MSDEVEKAALRQKIDEAIREAKRREVGAKDVNPYNTAVIMLDRMKKLIDKDISKEERKKSIDSFSKFLTHMLEPADEEFSHQLYDIGYQYMQLFDLLGFRS